MSIALHCIQLTIASMKVDTAIAATSRHRIVYQAYLHLPTQPLHTRHLGQDATYAIITSDIPTRCQLHYHHIIEIAVQDHSTACHHTTTTTTASSQILFPRCKRTTTRNDIDLTTPYLYLYLIYSSSNAILASVLLICIVSLL